MSKRCYFRPGGLELCDGIACETLVADESREDELRADGWRRSPLDFESGGLESLREQARAAGIKGWQRMSEATLRERLRDGYNQE